MHDVRTLLELGSVAEKQLSRRAFRFESGTLSELAGRRRDAASALDRLRAEARRGHKSDERVRGRKLKDEIRRLEAEHRAADQALATFLLAVPNLPADDVPDGKTAADAVEIRRSGTPRVVREPLHHAEIAERLSIMDLATASKLSGARFSVTRGAGAMLERALADFFLDLHTTEHGYTEYSVPSLVTRRTMTGTGQLPKFEDDLFRTEVGGRELFLIPTAEVPLTNLHADDVIAEDALPLAVTAHTRCFRAEAGSYGRDTRGILRLHEFGKVELVRFGHPERSRDELAAMVGHVEECLRRLELDYRVVLLPAGDMGFAARTTYDIEVWLPSQQRYREISSCSDCGTFQARRANIRARGRDGRKWHPATLNGSGLPIGRTLAALLEQHQEPDGGVVIPEALRPYTRFRRITPTGVPVTAMG